MQMAQAMFGLAASIFVLSGCTAMVDGGDPAGDGRSEAGDRGTARAQLSYDVCGVSTSTSEIEGMLQGDLFIAGVYREQGRSAGEMATATAITMVLNGIDSSGSRT